MSVNALMRTYFNAVIFLHSYQKEVSKFCSVLRFNLPEEQKQLQSISLLESLVQKVI